MSILRVNSIIMYVLQLAHAMSTLSILMSKLKFSLVILLNQDVHGMSKLDL
jgi:hypothetical protein